MCYNPQNSLTAYYNSGCDVTFLWSNGETSQSINIADKGTYCVTLTDCNGCKNYDCANMFVIYPPLIKNQPKDGFACEGASYEFSIKADSAGEPYYYQWFKNSQLIEGGTDSDLNINNVSQNDDGEYACLVSNFCGELMSNSAQLKVKSPPVITEQPTGGTFCSGKQIILTVGVSGNFTGTYKWYLNGQVKAITSDKFIQFTASQENAGTYRCRVTNECGEDMSQDINVEVQNCVYLYKGVILYKNLKRGPLKNAAVNLRSKDGSIYRRAEADNYGRYEMTDVSDTTFTVEADISETWGGADPLDALLINRKFIHIYDITDNLKLSAADINKDGAITPTDALLANRRFIGLIDSFKQDWLWETERIQQISRKEFYYEIRAICTGDVNASFNPSGKKK
jgi:hypothetical protein